MLEGATPIARTPSPAVVGVLVLTRLTAALGAAEVLCLVAFHERYRRWASS